MGRHTGACLAATIVALMATIGAEGSIPTQLAYLRCLQPVTLTYAMPATSAANPAQDAAVLEEVLANAGLPEPLVTVRGTRVQITTYAASEPDLERLQQLVERELESYYPGYRLVQKAHFAVVSSDAQQAMEVVARRLGLAGYDGRPGLLGPNQFVVSAQTMDRDLEWAWERRGLFEARLLPGDIEVSFSRGPAPASPWRPAASQNGRTVDLSTMVRRSPLVISNRLPVLKATVWQVPGHPDQSVVSFTLAPPAASRLKEMTGGAGGYTLAFVWDGRVIEGLMARHAIEDPRVSSVDFVGEAGRREAERLALCLQSGPLPVPVAAQPPRVEIPESVTAFLRSAYPGWRLISYDDYGPALWSDRFARLGGLSGEDYHPFIVRGDFDGNGKPDWAMLLKHGGQVALVALHHAGTTWRPHLVSQFPYRIGFPVGLSGFDRHLEPTREGLSRRNWALGRAADLPGSSFELVCPGKVAWLWKWDGSKYLRFASRD